MGTGASRQKEHHMARYKVTLQHVPGHGLRDHLYPELAAAILDRLAPTGYAHEKSAIAAVRRLTPLARTLSTFDGRFTYRILTTD
jgi:hypothetical protein